MGIYSRDEIEQILREYGDMIYRMAYVQVKKYDVADDIYQEVSMRLMKQTKPIEPEEHLKAWLLRTTINCCKDYWKSSWMQRVSSVNDEGMNLEESALEEQEPGYVTECVHRLPKKYRIVIHLYYYEGYSQKEIATLLDRKENTIASWLKRGREQLRKMLEESEGCVYEF